MLEDPRICDRAVGRSGGRAVTNVRPRVSRRRQEALARGSSTVADGERCDSAPLFAPDGARIRETSSVASRCGMWRSDAAAAARPPAARAARPDVDDGSCWRGRAFYPEPRRRRGGEPHGVTKRPRPNPRLNRVVIPPCFRLFLFSCCYVLLGPMRPGQQCDSRRLRPSRRRAVCSAICYIAFTDNVRWAAQRAPQLARASRSRSVARTP